MEPQRWYAVATQRLHDLDARADIKGLGLLAYVPCETVERRMGRTKRKLHRPVWPGYLFVLCGPEDFRSVMDLETVHDFIRAAREPIALPANSLVPVLLAEAFGDLDYTRQPKSWSPMRGDRVIVRTGVWRGYFGRIISVGRRTKLEMEKGGKMDVKPDSLELAA